MTFVVGALLAVILLEFLARRGQRVLSERCMKTGGHDWQEKGPHLVCEKCGFTHSRD